MALEPITRAEQIMSGENLEPITREEMFLAKAAGMDVNTPEPITRREMFLSKISGGSGGDYEAMLAGVIDGTATHVTIPAGVTKIKPYAFYDSIGMLAIDIPNHVTEIGRNAFDGCTALLSVVIPSSVTSVVAVSVGYGQFRLCESLQSVVIEAGVETLKGPIFDSCTALKTVIIKGSLTFATSAGQYAFNSCTGITDIYVPWAEGEVAGAPWGAKNATIHYNCTGG